MSMEDDPEIIDEIFGKLQEDLEAAKVKQND